MQSDSRSSSANGAPNVLQFRDDEPKNLLSGPSIFFYDNFRDRTLDLGLRIIAVFDISCERVPMLCMSPKRVAQASEPSSLARRDAGIRRWVGGPPVPPRPLSVSSRPESRNITALLYPNRISLVLRPVFRPQNRHFEMLFDSKSPSAPPLAI